MNIRFLKDMPVACHEIEIDVGENKKIRVLQDFNCRFTTEGYILFTTFVAPRGYYTHVFWGV